MAGGGGAHALRGTRVMDVLHVDPERGWGGGEVQVMALLRELARRGHRSRLAADPRGRLAREAAAAGVPVEALPVANALDVRAGAHLRALVAGHDVVHFHTARAHALAPFCRGRGARLVVTRRMDYVPRGGVYARWLYNRAVDAVIAISEGVRDGAPARGRAGRPHPRRPERDRRRPRSTRRRVRAPPSAPGGASRRTMSWSSCSAPSSGAKGTPCCSTPPGAWRRSGPPLRYVFAGDGSERAALAGAAHELGDRVVFAGFRQDVARLPRGGGRRGAAVAARRARRGRARGDGGGAPRRGEPRRGTRRGGGRRRDGTLRRAGRAGVARGRARDAGEGSATCARGSGRAVARRVLARYTAARMAEGTLACYGEAPCAA